MHAHDIIRWRGVNAWMAGYLYASAVCCLHFYTQNIQHDMYVGFAIESIFCVEFNSQDFCLRSKVREVFLIFLSFFLIFGVNFTNSCNSVKCLVNRYQFLCSSLNCNYDYDGVSACF